MQKIIFYNLIKHLRIETFGWKGRSKCRPRYRAARSAYSITKEKFRLKGNKEKVLEQLQNIYKEARRCK